MKKIGICMFCLFFCFNGQASELGKKYRGWKKGEMDIHHIQTGRGEANFFILPDGTTMLIDAGDWNPSDYPQMSLARPDSSRRAGEWVARYVEQVNPSKDKVDYLMISHFHNDHTGDSSNPAGYFKEGDFVLSGVTQTGQSIQFGKIYDRGYPNYDYPLPITDPDVTNYRKYTEWAKQKFNTRMERFVPGKENQLALLRNPKKYKQEFSIRNLCASAEVWTGRGEETIRYYDANPQNKEGYQNENTMSLGLLIAYGPFRYYTGGDVSGRVLDASGEDIGIEEKIARLCGPVDICKANHHGYLDAMTEGFVREIQASAYILPVWDYYHINDVTMARMASQDLYPGERKIFATDIQEAVLKDFANASWMKTLAPESGHIVVKVANHGKEYWIYVLSDENEDMIVKAKYGPYIPKKIK
jgi:beta-lactamase superfamily II metal-dependent hydrolase